MSEHMPTANAEDPCRSERTYRCVSTQAFPTLPSDSVWPSVFAVGMRRKFVKKNRSACGCHPSVAPLPKEITVSTGLRVCVTSACVLMRVTRAWTCWLRCSIVGGGSYSVMYPIPASCSTLRLEYAATTQALQTVTRIATATSIQLDRGAARVSGGSVVIVSGPEPDPEEGWYAIAPHGLQPGLRSHIHGGQSVRYKSLPACCLLAACLLLLLAALAASTSAAAAAAVENPWRWYGIQQLRVAAG